MSRVPIAAAGPKARPAPHRAHMLRTAAVKPRAHRVRRAAIARPVRLAAAHRPRPRAAAPPATRGQPTPYLMAAQEQGVPAAYTLIHTTVCETAPPPMLMSLRGGLPLAPPVEDAGVGAPAEDVLPGGTTFFEGPTGGFFPPDTFFPPDIGGVLPPFGPPPGQPGQPPVTETPLPPPVVTVPPDTEGPLPPVVTPPDTGGPGQPPVVTPPGPPGPPGQPPVVPPETPPGGVPEPATWALMILGFGAVGAALRRPSVRAR